MKGKKKNLWRLGLFSSSKLAKDVLASHLLRFFFTMISIFMLKVELCYFQRDLFGKWKLTLIRAFFVNRCTVFIKVELTSKALVTYFTTEWFLSFMY